MTRSPRLPKLPLRLAWAYASGKRKHLSLAERAVLRHVAYRAGRPDGACYEAHQNMADELGVARETVARALKVLVKQGLLSARARFQRATIYRLPQLCAQITIGGEPAPNCDLTSHPEAPNSDLTSHQLCAQVTHNGTLKEKKSNLEIQYQELSSLSRVRVTSDHNSEEAILEALEQFADSHKWRSVGAAVSHYRENPAMFERDLKSWKESAETYRRPALGRYY